MNRLHLILALSHLFFVIAAVGLYVSAALPFVLLIAVGAFIRRMVPCRSKPKESMEYPFWMFVFTCFFIYWLMNMGLQEVIDRAWNERLTLMPVLLFTSALLYLIAKDWIYFTKLTPGEVNSFYKQPTSKSGEALGKESLLRNGLKLLGWLVLSLIALGLFLHVMMYVTGAGSNQGSPELASEWRSQLSRYQDPDAAAAENHEIWIIRFDNGEWIFGLAQTSHGIWRRGGGTVVTKDSNGEVRAYFGHVCMPTAPFDSYSVDDLPSLYQKIEASGFRVLEGVEGGSSTKTWDSE